MKTKLSDSLYYMILVRFAKTYLRQKWSLNVLFILMGLATIAQTGTLKITVTDSKTKEAIPFATARVMQQNVKVGSSQADFNGSITITALAPGKYAVKVIYIGYQSLQINNVIITAGKVTYLNAEMINEGVDLCTVVIEDYKIDLIDKDTKSGGTVDRESFVHMADKSVNSVMSTQSGVYQYSSGVNIRGSRPGGTNYFVDGERMIGTSNLPQQSVEQVSVNMGGVPAQYESGQGSAGNFHFFKKDHPVTKAPPTPPAGTEEYHEFVENAFKAVGSNPLSTFAIDVDGASYSNARRMLSAGYLPPKDAVRLEEFVNYFKYHYPAVTGEHPFGIFTEYAECPWNSQHKMLSVALKGKEIDAAMNVPNHLVFLIDVSGSMNEPDKLPLLKRAFALLIKQLRAEDRISIVVYVAIRALCLRM